MRRVTCFLVAAVAGCASTPASVPTGALETGPPPGYVRVAALDVAELGDLDAIAVVDRPGRRLLPVAIGEPDAEALRRRMRGAPADEPGTRELLDDALDAVGARVVRVQLDGVRGGTPVASVYLWSDRTTLVLEARPVDALALALAHDAPIYAARALLQWASIPLERLQQELAPSDGGGPGQDPGPEPDLGDAPPDEMPGPPALPRRQ